METATIKTQLESTIKGLNCDIELWAESIDKLNQKLEFLNNTGRYSKLLNALFSSNEKDNFKSYVLEASFAYDFESRGGQLSYEITQVSDGNTSIDFLFEFVKNQLYFEIRLIQQAKSISDSEQEQISQTGEFHLSLDEEGERDQIARLQQETLSKCQDKNNSPIKFFKTGPHVYNIIVVYVSDLILGCIDREDCRLAAYGNVGVGEFYQRNIFGLFQEWNINNPAEMEKYWKKFKHFRETISGILFLKSASRNDGFLNLDLEYLLMPNPALFTTKPSDPLLLELSKYMKPWQERDTHSENTF